MPLVQILGHAWNLIATPDRSADPSVEQWVSGHPRIFRKKLPRAMKTWTRYVNVHSHRHMVNTYPHSIRRDIAPHVAAGRRAMLRDGPLPDLLPTAERFPGRAIMTALDSRFFSFSGAWMIGLAMIEGFDAIELCGFEMARDRQYDHERPCFFYWVERARELGIEVIVPSEVGPGEAGDPDRYPGPLYGYETTEPHTVPE